MRRIVNLVFALFWVVCASGFSANSTETTSILITNARIFDGEHEKLAEGMSVLVEGNPLESQGAITDVDNLKIIMKDGKIYKNTLR